MSSRVCIGLRNRQKTCSVLESIPSDLVYIWAQGRDIDTQEAHLLSVRYL